MSDENPRRADHDIEPLFLERHSPRAFTGEAVPRAELMRMLEAARWAPSSYNSQPWRFLYALRDDAHWAGFLDLLVPSNRAWVEGAGALVVLVSSETMTVGGEVKPSWSHSLDAGAASMAFQLQAIRQGWHAHGMVGFDRERAVALLKVPDGYRVEAAYAVGRKVPLGEVAEERRAREVPNGRRPLADLVFAGAFPAQDT